MASPEGAQADVGPERRRSPFYPGRTSFMRVRVSIRRMLVGKFAMLPPRPSLLSDCPGLAQNLLTPKVNNPSGQGCARHSSENLFEISA
jgi:hypothetical protein